MTTTEDEQQLGNSTTGYVPMFSGSKADYDSFKEDIDDWEFSTKIPKETRAARLILVQIEQVKKIMRTVPKEQREQQKKPRASFVIGSVATSWTTIATSLSFITFLSEIVH